MARADLTAALGRLRGRTRQDIEAEPPAAVQPAKRQRVALEEAPAPKRQRVAIPDLKPERVAVYAVAKPAPCVFATATRTADIGKLSDQELSSVGNEYGFAGNRETVQVALTELFFKSVPTEVDKLFDLVNKAGSHA